MSVIVEAIVTDLWAEPYGGWSANGSRFERQRFEFDDNPSDRAIAIRIRKHFDLGRDWKRDEWSGSDWSWRSGCMGCYADVIDE